MLLASEIVGTVAERRSGALTFGMDSPLSGLSVEAGEVADAAGDDPDKLLA